MSAHGVRWLRASRRRQHAHGRSRPAPHGLRADVQGLRAFAVLAVVADHLVGWPHGGFVGVDVFFVISGFLITGLLLREHDRTGTISWTGFYTRRVKRILPASTLVVVVTLVLSALVLPAYRAKEVGLDGLWALLFSVNWRFATEQTDYFDQARAISPLQHYWSLGVEEQFYFVWPWLMLAIFALVARRAVPRARQHAAAAALMTVVIAASLVWAMVQTGTDATAAYFSTLTRVWELGVGALLAIAVPLLRRIPERRRPVLAWTGLAGMVASLWLVDGESGWPAPWALLPVLATALVIAAGTGPEGYRVRFLWPLTNRGSGWVGDLSYSLYLWHFPAIVLLAAVMDPESPAYLAVVLLLTVATAAFSYYVVEEPLRRTAWRSLRRRGMGLPAEVRLRSRYASLGLVVTATLALAIFAVASQPRGAEPAYLAALSQPTGDDDEGALDPESPEGRLQAELRDSLLSPAFPASFDPDLSTLTTEDWIASLRQGVGCSDVFAENEADCVFGPTEAPRTAVVLGDSYAMAWMPAVRAALDDHGFRTHQLTRGECPAWDLPIGHDDGSAFPECDDQLSWAVGRIRAMKPDLVIVAQSDTGTKRLLDAPDPASVASGISTGLGGTLASLTAAAGTVVVLGSPPAGATLQECVTSFGSTQDCVSRVSEGWRTVFTAEEEAAESAGAVHLDTRAWFCVADVCPGWVGSTPIRADSGHMTLAYSRSLGPLLWDRLDEVLKSRPA